MAINFPTTPRYTQEEMGAMPDLQQAMMQGLQNYMQMQMQPKQMAEQLLSQQLQNKMQGIKAQYAEPTARANLELIEARKAKAMQPSIARTSAPRGMSSFGKAMSDAERIGQQYGTDSEEYKLAQGYAKKLAMGLGTKAGRMPGAAPQRQGRVSAATEKAQAGSSVFDYVNPIILKQPYVGTMASAQLADDLKAYKFGSAAEKKQAEKRLIDFGVSTALVPEHTSGTLLSQRIPATVPSLAHQMKATTQGWPMLYEKQASLLPKDIQQKIKAQVGEHQSRLKSLSTAGSKQESSQTEDPLGIL